MAKLSFLKLLLSTAVVASLPQHFHIRHLLITDTYSKMGTEYIIISCVTVTTFYSNFKNSMACQTKDIIK